MPSKCAAVGCSEKLTKEFSFHAFPLKKIFFFLNEARKWQWQMAMNQWDLATKKWEPKHHDVLCSKHFEKNAWQIAPCRAFSLGSNTCPQGNWLGKNSSSNLQGWSSNAIASSWAFVYFPLSFHLSRALLGMWRFSLFCCIYSSFHNRLDLIREPAFYWVFYFIFPIYPCLFHHRFIHKDETVFFALVQ